MGGCSGETDISRYERIGGSGDIVATYDAQDAGAVQDVSTGQDGSTVQDGGKQCIPNTAARVMLSISVGDDKKVIEKGDAIEINGKTFEVNVDDNNGELVLIGPGNEIYVSKNGEVNVGGSVVKKLDQSTDLLAYDSRVLVKVTSGGNFVFAILGHDDEAVLSLDSMSVKLASHEMQSWNNAGDSVNVDVKVVMDSNTAELSGAELSKSNPAKVTIDDESVGIEAVEFLNEVFPKKDVEACSQTKVVLSAAVDGHPEEVVDYEEGNKIVLSVDNEKVAEVAITKVFPGVSGETKKGEVEISTGNGTELRMVSPGDHITIDTEKGRVGLTVVDMSFRTEEADH